MRKLKKIILICLAAYLAVAGFLTVRLRLKTALQTFAETSGNAALTYLLQESLYQHLRTHDNEKFLTLHYDSANRITAISVHSEAVSVLASEMTMVMLDALEGYHQSSFGIPLGNLTDFVLLSGKGPLIPLQPVAMGNITNEIQSRLQSAGINQTLHKIVLRFSLAVRYLSPIESYADTLSIDIVVAETLVVGEVPIYRD